MHDGGWPTFEMSAGGWPTLFSWSLIHASAIEVGAPSFAAFAKGGNRYGLRRVADPLRHLALFASITSEGCPILSRCLLAKGWADLNQKKLKSHIDIGPCSHPCKERKSGAPSVVVISDIRKAGPPASQSEWCNTISRWSDRRPC